MTTATTSIALDVEREANYCLGLVLQSMVADALRRAEVCKCAGCRAQAAETVEWVGRLLGPANGVNAARQVDVDLNQQPAPAAPGSR